MASLWVSLVLMAPASQRFASNSMALVAMTVTFVGRARHWDITSWLVRKVAVVKPVFNSLSFDFTSFARLCRWDGSLISRRWAKRNWPRRGNRFRRYSESWPFSLWRPLVCHAFRWRNNVYFGTCIGNRNPEFLVLDEPTNHLDITYQDWYLRLFATWYQLSGCFAWHCDSLLCRPPVAFLQEGLLFPREHLRTQTLELLADVRRWGHGTPINRWKRYQHWLRSINRLLSINRWSKRISYDPRVSSNS